MKRFRWSALVLASLVCAARSPAAEPVDPVSRFASQPGAPREDVLRLAIRAQACALKQGVGRSDLLALIDYSLPSTEPRFWVLDLEAGRVLFRELVAHGRGSGEDQATSFSNAPGSRKSSLGLYVTEETYAGSHGTSLRLKGLEPGVNDAARARAVVLHPASYVSAAYAKAHARLGRSWGCVALGAEVCQRVIDTLQAGTLLWAYYPDDRWLRSSRYLRCADD